MKVLGAIREVNEYDMAISLPNGLGGFVHITNINEKITERLKNILEVDESGNTEVRGYFKLQGTNIQKYVIKGFSFDVELRTPSPLKISKLTLKLP